MYYFLPSWYGRSQDWGEPDLSRHELLFDDTVNQMRLFHEADEDIQLILLNYMPHLRNRMHDQVLDQVAYWSLFDELQGFSQTESNPLSIDDLSWPQHIQFVPTPFTMLAYLDGEQYAAVNYTSEGWIHDVIYYRGNHWSKRLIFDDRGYLSSSYHYDDHGQVLKQVFFNCSGQAVLIHDHRTCQVSHENKIYDSMTSLVQDRLSTYLDHNLREEDVLVLANNPQHDRILAEGPSHYKLVYSLYTSRPFQPLLPLINSAELLMVDTEEKKDLLHKQYPQAAGKTLNLTPFDTRLRLGMSQRVKELIVFFQVDGVSDQVIEDFLTLVTPKIKKDPRIKVLFAGFHLSYDRELALRDSLQTYEAKFHSLDKGVEDFEDKMPDEEESPVFTVSQLETDKDLIQAFKSVRLVVDLVEEADLYTQIAAISAGIPQINRKANPYVDHQKNGMIAKNSDQLSQALDYYLQGLKHWNEALVYAVEKINRYHSQEIIDEWKRYLGESESDKSLTNRNS
ncbi:accessory Sec system protein Asp1 [Aerococcus sanguinicola]|uniref:accessory Sec system protein Asp1 n=2 Tax=Aerococcus TaxID=1375 RepID=UPI0008A35C0C|nr:MULTISPECIES: accessory Sec system protein Asp1 [unclassified Aerococcus]MDK6233992.1 accessory Sec system protein Asp1 [Aerococcus sp. UMB10185]MDK6856538.1 accessory Sec system protein Asp1 [Aerococcus sp. UMB7533]MDK8502052.1 accessory Sec system protein Asp1 [Aerococcus sp. UMB1112A]OFN03429.1 hypothetical protein HMPREF2626_06020 [Aerococcus sp. HMSC062A02]OHO45751.1 hypothetical protein HMPREF2705_04125 [Aerococcus sp. HMSC035B07]